MTTRFWSKVNKHGPRAGRLGCCWVWTAAHDQDGYGLFKLKGKMLRAHRVAWGDVPLGLNVLHHCDNPPCVRRSHLFLGTVADNNHDAIAKGRSTGSAVDCPAGHPYDEENTYHWRGRRCCRACSRARSYAYYLRGKEQAA